MSGDQISIQTYLDTRFEDLKKYLDEKFDSFEKADDSLCQRLNHLENRVKKLETWKAMTYGGFVVVGVILKPMFDALWCLIQ